MNKNKNKKDLIIRLICACECTYEKPHQMFKLNINIFLSLSSRLNQFSLGFEVGNNHACLVNRGKEVKHTHSIFECMPNAFLGTHPVYQVYKIQVR